MVFSPSAFQTLIFRGMLQAWKVSAENKQARDTEGWERIKVNRSAPIFTTNKSHEILEKFAMGLFGF